MIAYMELPYHSSTAGIAVTSLPSHANVVAATSRLVKRKVVQIAVRPGWSTRGIFGFFAKNYPPIIYALCADGSLWLCKLGEQWEEVPSVPDKHVTKPARSLAPRGAAAQKKEKQKRGAK